MINSELTPPNIEAKLDIIDDEESITTQILKRAEIIRMVPSTFIPSPLINN